MLFQFLRDRNGDETPIYEIDETPIYKIDEQPTKEQEVEE